jgi:hypothetical protein
MKGNVSAQTRFGSDGLEVEDSTETDLADWGIHEPGPERETQIEQGGSGELVDDRQQVSESEHEQERLFVDVEDDQQTLGGDDAAGQSVW